MKKLRITIIGTNHMGRIHAQIIKNYLQEEAILCGVMNSRSETTQKAASEFNVEGYNNLNEISSQNTDAIVISTPTNTHYKIAKELIPHRIPLLIEKPFAETKSQCEELIKLAQKHKTPIMIGHTENYNPAFLKLKENLHTPIISINCIRTSKNGAKNRSHVISELMIHDIAIINALINEKPFKSKVQKNENYTWGEHAVVEMDYCSGTKIILEAKNHPETPIKRKMKLEDSNHNLWEIDFNQQSLSKNSAILSKGGNSLVNEWKDFIKMVKFSTTPQVTLEASVTNVEICNQLEAQTKTKNPQITNIMQFNNSQNTH